MAKATKATAVTMITGTDDAAKAAVLARIQSLGFKQIGKAGTICYVEPDTDADFESLMDFQTAQLGPVPESRDLEFMTRLHDSIGVDPVEANDVIVDAVKTLTNFTCPPAQKFTHEHNSAWNSFRNRKRPAILVLWFATGMSPAGKSITATPASDAQVKQAQTKRANLLKRLG